jgi:hypothetical protein
LLSNWSTCTTTNRPAMDAPRKMVPFVGKTVQSGPVNVGYPFVNQDVFVVGKPVNGANSSVGKY